MRRSCFRKKSDPKIGWLTAAILKECLVVRGPNERDAVLEPKHGIYVPLAALSGGFLVAEERWMSVAGKTDTSAPLSMRKDRLLLSSTMESEPEMVLMEAPGPIGARLWRVPTWSKSQRHGPSCNCQEPGICVLPGHT